MNDPNVVSPGILGFLAFFFLAVALYLLVRNMNGHLRRMRYRAEQLEGEKAEPPPEASPEGEPTAEQPPPEEER
jgi:hypothetical protein